MSNYAKERRQFSSTQRHHDNLTPAQERQRRCRCCGRWVYEMDFKSAQSHVCFECEWDADVNADVDFKFDDNETQPH